MTGDSPSGPAFIKPLTAVPGGSGSWQGAVPADVFRSTQTYQEAIKAYNKAIELDPMTSIAITARVLSATQNLLDSYTGILDDFWGRNPVQ
ncbi:MAG: hypothetical protein A4E35_01980 [Methanoregula sp. PtaU1.Bin051]|nr:MAG: hypothetical protein A4E35_01980 [Methanoregula sp. PtaU1.Bin051]